MKVFTSLFTILLTLSPIFADEEAIVSAYREGDYDKVIELTADGEHDQIRSAAFQRRGELRFFDADIDGSIKDFDAVVELDPAADPHHWQRGLSYYYAEEYEKGKAQFERHQIVNSQDVENAAWHFICAVRAPGGSVESARKEFIPITRDARVPMKEIHALFSGEGSAEEVLEAAGDERNALCYAHLYLGLYYEALGDEEKSADHIRKAAYDYSMDHYMGKTAQVHAKLRGIEGE